MQSFIPREAPEFGFNKILSIWTNWEFLIIYEGSVASHSNMTHTSHDWYILVIDFVGGRMFQAPCYLKIYCVRAQECSVQVDENIVSWKGQDQVHCCKQGPLLFQSIFANTLVFGVSFSPSQSPFLVLYVPVPKTNCGPPTIIFWSGWSPKKTVQNGTISPILPKIKFEGPPYAPCTENFVLSGPLFGMQRSPMWLYIVLV